VRRFETASLAAQFAQNVPTIVVTGSRRWQAAAATVRTADSIPAGVNLGAAEALGLAVPSDCREGALQDLGQVPGRAR